MPLVDVHCDLTHPDVPVPVENQLEEARARGVGDVVMVGTDPPSWERQRVLWRRHPSLHCTFGWHPWWVRSEPGGDRGSTLDALARAITTHEVAGVGEIGLDYSGPDGRASRDYQVDMLRHQLGLARDHGLPVVLHVVRAHGDLLDTLRRDGLPDAGGMIHGFSGSVEVARDYLALGLHLSFSSCVLRPDYKRARAACRHIPLNRLLIETDAPDQAGQGHRGSGQVRDLIEVCATVARLRDEQVDIVAAATSQNARTLFRISERRQRP